MTDLKTKIIDKSFNFEDDDGTFKSSTIFLKDLFEIPEIKQLILSGVSQQRELLIAYNVDFYRGIHDVNLKDIELNVDKYLSNL